MHPATLRQFTASHIREPTIEAGDTRRAGNGNAGIGRSARMLWRQVAARPRSSQTIRAGVEPAVQRRGAI
jgi:hypothetical protein